MRVSSNDTGEPCKKRRKQSECDPSLIPGTDIKQPIRSSVRAAKVFNLPQEYELARLTQDMNYPHSSWNASTPACEWDGVMCDDKYKVVVIDWKTRFLTGMLHLEHLPRSTLNFVAHENKLNGTAILDNLPCVLHRMSLYRNHLDGELNLTALPQAMRELYLQRNEFTGGINLCSLPTEMNYLELSHNLLFGTPDLTKLPFNIKFLSLSHNNFSGEINLTRLPRYMQRLDFENNSDLRGEGKRSFMPLRLGCCYSGTQVTILD